MSSESIVPPTLNNSSAGGLDPLEGGDVSKVVTTTFVEQRNLITEDARVTGSDFSNDYASRSAISELPMSLLPTFEKPSLLSSFSWTGGQATGDKIYFFNFPQVLAALSGPQQIFLRLYSLFRMSFEIRIQVNSNKFNVGRLIGFFMPAFGTDVFASNPYISSGFPSVYLDASESSVRTIVIPFTSVQEYFTTNINKDVNTLGVFAIQVVNPLIGSTNVNVSVYVRAINPSLHLPIADHTPLVPQGFAEAITAGAAALGSGVNGISKLITGDFSGGFKSMSRGFGKLSTSFAEVGLDQPINPVADYGSVARAMPSHSRAVGPVDDESLSLIPALEGVCLLDEYFSTAGDEMDVSRIVSTPMLFKIAEWNSSSPAFTQIASFVVSPMVCHKTSATVAYPTYLSYASSAYCYWTGGIKYHFSIVSTPFHTGRVMVYYEPFISGESTVKTLIEASAFPNMVFDLQTGKEFDFIVPYNCFTGRRLTCPAARTKEDDHFTFDTNIVPFIEATETLDQWGLAQGITGDTLALMSLGRLVMVVQNPLNAPASVSPIVQINVSISGADDFVLSKPRDNNFSAFRSFLPPTADIDNNLYPLADVEIADSRTTMGSGVTATAQQGEGKHEIAYPNYENKEMHLKVFLSRMFHLATTNLETPKNAPISIPAISIPVTPAASYFNSTNLEVATDNMFSHFSRIFRFFTGGIRYHIVAQTASIYNELMIAAHIPSAVSDSRAVPSRLNLAPGEPAFRALSNYQHQVTSLGYQNSINVVCPYRSVYDRLFIGTRLLGEVDGRLAAANGTLMVALKPSSKTNGAADLVRPDVEVSVYYGPADDFRMFYLVPPGGVVFPGPVSATPSS